MAIAVVYKPPAMTVDQYNASWSGREGPPLPLPSGLIFHAGVGTGNEFFTLTVWNSREAYDIFAPQFKQAMSELGFEFGEPSVFPVHHYIAP